MAHATNELLTSLLKSVSRSFYSTLRILPPAIRPQIGLAYLLARMTDTVADSDIVPLDQRLRGLRALRDRILGTSVSALDFGELVRRQGSPAERALLEKCETSLTLLESFPATDQKLIREVLATITSGPELDLRRFATASARQIVALRTDEELDDYTYRVAGCVGKFWTAMSVEHQFADLEILGESVLTSPHFEQLGIRFGKGLQLVNILRDVPEDLRKGRCYLPETKLREIGLAPIDLLNPEQEPKFRPLFHRYLDLAESHLTAGWEYTNLIPFGQARLRLACAWPILIGLGTIQRLRRSNVLLPQQRVKISRNELYAIVFRSVVCYPVPIIWRRLARPAGGADRGKAVASVSLLT
jgi:farnesyl-diphosphate farnesyltransferase